MKKNNKFSSSQKKPIKTSKPVQKTATSNKIVLFGKQILVALAGLFLLYQVKESSEGYQWVYEGLLKGNMETIKKYPNLSVGERYKIKIGFPMYYFDYIKENTPDTAIILFPDFPVFLETKDPNQDLSGMHSWYVTKYAYYRFLYPRKVVFEAEKDASLFFKKVTHVAIVNGWGYDYLSYPVPEGSRVYNTVLPINSQQ